MFRLIKKGYLSSNGIVFKFFSLKNRFYLEKEYNFIKTVNFLRRNYFRCKTIKFDKILVFTHPWSWINYYHWLIESVINIEQYLDDKNYVVVIPSKFYNEDLISQSLMPFGIDSSKIFIINDYEKVKGNKIFFLKDFYSNQKESIIKYSTRVKDFYRDKLNKNFGDKLYIYRNNRNVINEKEFRAIVIKYSFIPIKMEEYSFVEQVSILSFATHILAVHGAGLSNMIFMNKGGKIFEINYKNPTRLCFKTLSQSCSHSHFLYEAENSSQNYTDDMLIDLNHFENCFKNFIN
jgi:capsular polysaccharide biosynthesis protein